MTLSSGWALFVHSRDDTYRLPARVTAGWSLAVALLLALIILMS